MTHHRPLALVQLLEIRKTYRQNGVNKLEKHCQVREKGFMPSCFYCNTPIKHFKIYPIYRIHLIYFVNVVQLISLPFAPGFDSGAVAVRPPPLRVQNCSCSKLCLTSQPFSLSRESTSRWSILTSSARHSERRKLLASSCGGEGERL